MRTHRMVVDTLRINMIGQLEIAENHWWDNKRYRSRHKYDAQDCLSRTWFVRRRQRTRVHELFQKSTTKWPWPLWFQIWMGLPQIMLDPLRNKREALDRCLIQRRSCPRFTRFGPTYKIFFQWIWLTGCRMVRNLLSFSLQLHECNDLEMVCTHCTVRSNTTNRFRLFHLFNQN